MSLTNEEIIAIASRVLNKKYTRLKIEDADGVTVKMDDGIACVGGKTVPQKLRALTLLALHEGEGALDIFQKPRNETVGAMLDVSRGGVMKPNRVKDYIDRLALFGANALMLYTENSFCLP